MTARAAALVGLLASTSCVGEFEPEGRSCPCIRGWICNETVGECVQAIERDFTPVLVGSDADLHHGRGDVVVPAGEHWLFHTDTGTVTVHANDDLTGDPRETIREGTGVDADIGFVVLDDRRLGVFTLGSLRVQADASVVFAGTNAAALLSFDTIAIEGLISAGAERVPSQPGPGGGTGAPYSTSAEPDPGSGPLDLGGGGSSRGAGSGGSYGGCGGAGGAVPAVAPGRASSPWAAQLDGRFVGGAGGGSGGAGSNNACSGHSYPGQRGGHGGGAVALIATNAIFVGPTAAIDARGGGGSGGRVPAVSPESLFNLASGSGGGSGGAILLSAPVVDVAGTLAANGGGGGGGAGGIDRDGDTMYDEFTAGADGAHGTLTAEPAPGGEGAFAGGDGGTGSGALGCASDGGLGDASMPGAIGRTGGGGGGSGVIYILSAMRTIRDTALLRPSQSSMLVALGDLEGPLPPLPAAPACECPSPDVAPPLAPCGF